MPPPPPVDVGSCARAAVDDWVMRGLPEGPRLLGEDSPLGEGSVWSLLRMLLLFDFGGDRVKGRDCPAPRGVLDWLLTPPP